MARSLRGLGFLLLAAAVWLVLAGAAGWARESWADSAARIAAVTGAASLAGGIALGLLTWVSRPIRQGRCARCGTRVERGQTYCLDHLMATVAEAREHARKGKSTPIEPVSRGR